MSVDDKWEYEYSQTEVETFLVDIDLTSINQHVAPSTGKKVPRSLQLPKDRDQQISSQQRGSPQKEAYGTQSPGGNNDVDENGNDQDPEVEEINAQSNATHNQIATGQDLQVLDLTTDNPLVSFRGNLYSCSWVDMIGTNMFFAHPRHASAIVPEASTKDYNLLGKTRIKLVGHQAKVTPVDPTKKPPVDGTAPNQDIRPGASLGDLKSTNPKNNIETRKQANFLQQLIDLKKARGDPDVVKVVADTNDSVAPQNSSVKTPAKRKQIDELNVLALQGNGEAIKKLKGLYSGLNDSNTENDPDEDAITQNASA